MRCTSWKGWRWVLNSDCGCVYRRRCEYWPGSMRRIRIIVSGLVCFFLVSSVGVLEVIGVSFSFSIKCLGENVPVRLFCIVSQVF